MKTFIATIALLLLLPALVNAQATDWQSRGQGYFFIAPIVSNTQYIFNHTARGGVNTGFGGEGFVYRGLGIGGEAGYAASNWSFNGNDGLGVVSIDASYHFRNKNPRRIEPFIVGGYSLYYGDRTDTQNGFNLGGGVNLWVAKHAAVRLEVRDQDHIRHFHSPFTRFVAFRVGMTFR